MINNHLKWTDDKIWLNGTLAYQLNGENATDWVTNLYKSLALNYIKFFKMDILSKAGYIASELLINNLDLTEEEKNNTSLYICTKNGCIDIDAKYQATLDHLASPALFVYTLPNIVLGEISIKHKLKGEQMCYVAPYLDEEDLESYITDIFNHRDQLHCLAGFIDTTDNHITIDLRWYSK